MTEAISVMPYNDLPLIESNITSNDVEVQSVIINRYYDRMMKQNKNWLAIMTGPTGSGKSYSALSIAETLDPSFNLDRIVFTPQDFMRLFIDNKVGKGQMVIWEEAGVTMGARDFMSKVNKAINYFIQSFRSKNTGVIFTLPSMMMIDTQIRNLAHTLMQPIGLDKDNKLAIIKLFEIQHNPVSGETYQKYIRAFINGGVYKVNRIAVRIPSVQLRKAYEDKKELFLQSLASDTLSKLMPEDTNENGQLDINEIAQKIIVNPEAFYGSRGKLTISSIGAKLNIPHVTATHILDRYYQLKKEMNDRIMRAAIFPMEAEHNDIPIPS